MKFVIRAADGWFKRFPGDSISSRYDDSGYSCVFRNADLYDSYEEAGFALHKSGKFSIEAGAKIMAVLMEPVDCHQVDVPCQSCDGEGTMSTTSNASCWNCGGRKTVKHVMITPSSKEYT